ncbi:MAG: tail fiber domain-containing protein [Bacteriovoracaceae bacterium]|jgi:hypothetical protein|nr:tail fiber domain-containing protein [Bacteriovoracaceae bacterium]
MSDQKIKKEYDFGGVKSYSLEEIENIILNDAEYLDVFAGSDLRFKENITEMTQSLEKLQTLEAIKYNYKVEYQEQNGFSSKDQLGLIAQEISQVFPQAVAKDRDGFLRVNYQALVPALIESVQTLNSKISELEDEVKKLKSN